ncbi:hypothetical protein AB6A40_006879 [Gnathostoma spinigerum]|uniref:Uncharacterized protein n=1 Tax=Gnathostoma spinigerum TaxID=75299 RepID=A0ABD6EKU2_9BILA
MIRYKTTACEYDWAMCAKWFLEDRMINVTASWNLHGRSKDAELAARHVNLKIEFEWEPWSPCKAGSQLRTREGHCYIRKIDKSKSVDRMLDKRWAKSDPFTWVVNMVNHMDYIKEFREKGIRLYSGIMSKFLVLRQDEEWDKQQVAWRDECYRKTTSGSTLPYQRTVWYEAIFSAFGIESAAGMLDVADRLCVHYFEKKPQAYTQKTPTEYLVGSHIIDTEHCKPPMYNRNEYYQ